MARTRVRQLATVLVLAVVGFGAALGAAVPARALTPGAPSTELVMNGTGAGQGVSGAIAPLDDTSFDPLAGYPAGPPAGFLPQNLGFAGIITAAPPGGGPNSLMYCINLLTPTQPGIGYQLGTWDTSTVGLVGYVARVLNDYYPNVPGQPAAPNDNVRAAAVQAAVWFFSDRFVLNPGDPAFALTRSIATAVIAAGPEPSATPPTLTITSPPFTVQVTGSTVGPYTVNAGAPATGASLNVTGGTMYADAAGTTPIGPGTTVPTGQQVWLRASSPGTVVLSATATATVPSGNVYLYDQKSSVPDAQKLVLARQSTLSTSVTATGTFFDTGQLLVDKTVTGDGAGQQGEINLGVVCNDQTYPDVTVPAGAAAGTYQSIINDIPTPATCTVTEQAAGGNGTVTVSGSGPVTVTLPEDGIPNNPTTARLTDTVRLEPGSLTVDKRIAGIGAGRQGAIVLEVSCGPYGAVRHDTITIPAGATTSPARTYADLPAGTECAVTETETGANTTVAVSVAPPTPAQVVIGPGQASTVEVTNTYTLNPGDLRVTKTITGAAGRGDIVLDVACSNGETASFTIPAGADPDPAGYLVPGLPALTTCTVTESADGGNTSVAASPLVGPQVPAQIPAGGESTVAVTDTFTANPGSLWVTKTISGDGAGRRGDVVIAISCTNGYADRIAIPAGAPAPPRLVVDGLPAETSCTVSETADGHTGEVAAATVITPVQPVSITAGATAAVTVTNTYALLPGSLTVTKIVAGSGAPQRGDIVITVTCGQAPYRLSVPAGSDPQPLVIAEIPAGTACHATETANGANGQVEVAVEGLPLGVAIPPGGAVSAPITDTFSPRAGGLTITKVIGGVPAREHSGITLQVACGPNGSVITETLTVPAGVTTAEPVTLADLPAGTQCTVSEPVDGSTGSISVSTTFSPGRTVTVPTGAIVDLRVRNTYVYRAGTLSLTKVVTGTAAGSQGPIDLHVGCAYLTQFVPQPEQVSQDVTVPAAATGTHPFSFPGLPALITCTVSEPNTGATTDAGVTPAFAPAVSVPIPPGGTAAVTVTDTVTMTRLPDTGADSRGLGGLALGLVGLGAAVVAGAAGWRPGRSPQSRRRPSAR